MAAVIPFGPRESNPEGEAKRFDPAAAALKNLSHAIDRAEACVGMLKLTMKEKPERFQSVVIPRPAYALPPPGAPISQDVRMLMRRDWDAHEQLVRAARHRDAGRGHQGRLGVQGPSPPRGAGS